MLPILKGGGIRNLVKYPQNQSRGGNSGTGSQVEATVTSLSVVSRYSFEGFSGYRRCAGACNFHLYDFRVYQDSRMTNQGVVVFNRAYRDTRPET